jgi:hypothetical protein
LGRTVENTLRPNVKERNHKEQHITQSCFHRWNWVGLLKNTLKTKRKGITKSSTSLNPAIGRKLGGTVENTLKTNKERNHKEQHITQSLLS